ncbi:hypothetical protein E2C01_099925 [Portunus trituberculatus]|uniref:Uncharacterized protein n=1 Tax=Portunus trituberculatus TaxID=210409 RepID=A0A5B7KG39_PORTR|nr:hypothetical protein [Portunus trituberculatus]
MTLPTCQRTLAEDARGRSRYAKRFRKVRHPPRRPVVGCLHTWHRTVVASRPQVRVSLVCSGQPWRGALPDKVCHPRSCPAHDGTPPIATNAHTP